MFEWRFGYRSGSDAGSRDAGAVRKEDLGCGGSDLMMVRPRPNMKPGYKYEGFDRVHQIIYNETI